MAALAISSCSTFDRRDAVAEVKGVTLTRAELSLLTNNSAGGTEARTAISQWLTVAVLGGDVAHVAGIDDLNARRTKAIDALSAPFMDTARQKYAQGLDGSPVLCLAAIPLAPTTNPDIVLGELSGGTSFADAAGKYSIDANLAQSGGLIQDQSGASCLAPGGLSQELLTSMKTASAAVGATIVVDFKDNKVIIRMRPFEELSQTDKATIVQEDIGGEVKARLAATKVYVDPKYGKWDPKTVTVVPLEQS